MAKMVNTEDASRERDQYTIIAKQERAIMRLESNRIELGLGQIFFAFHFVCECGMGSFVFFRIVIAVILFFY
jgi:hypothetical protein